MSEDTYTLKEEAKPRANYPHVRKVGQLVFLAGTSSRRPDDTHEGVTTDVDGNTVLDIAAQTSAVIQNLEKLLASVGCGLNDIVDITSFLVDMKDFAEYNKVYNNFFTMGGPTRTTVAVHQLPHPNLLIEMKAIAKLPESA